MRNSFPHPQLSPRLSRAEKRKLLVGALAIGAIIAVFCALQVCCPIDGRIVARVPMAGAW